MAMANTRYFTPLPARIGKPITEAVSEFAKKTGLQTEMWVHDLPLWFLTSVDRDTGVVRRLQIAAYAMGTSDEVRMIPQVFKFDEKYRTLLTVDETNPDLIRTLPLGEAHELKRVGKVLEEAWANTLRLPPPQNSPTKAVVSIEVSPDFRL